MEKMRRQRMASVYEVSSGCSSLVGVIRDRYSSSGPTRSRRASDGVMTSRMSRDSAIKISRWLLCGAGLGALGVGGLKSLHAGERIDADRQKYAEQMEQTYSYRFGKGQPFLPSNAKIEGDTFIEPGAFPTAQYCQHCHEAAYRQWRQSVHANSFRTPFYTKNVGLLQNTKGMEFSRHCEGCHNPIMLFSGQVTPHPALSDRDSDQDGVTCTVCHSIQKLQPTY